MKRTYTFVPYAMHRLQRVQSEWNERARALLRGQGDFTVFKHKDERARKFFLGLARST
jgi:hypothetical protein